MRESDSNPSPDQVTTAAQAWPDQDLEQVESCPVCGSTQHTLTHSEVYDLWFGAAPGPWSFRECVRCGSGFLSPRPTPRSLPRAYSSYYTHHAQHSELSLPRVLWRRLRNDALRARYTAWPTGQAGGVGALIAKRSQTFERVIRTALMRELPAPEGPRFQRLLDVGCGAGTYLDWARNAGWNVEGVEPDLAAVRVAQAKGLRVIHGTLADVPSDSRYDRICLHHVLEHVYQPLRLIQECRSRLAPGGTLWIETPNWNARLHHAFGPSWRGLEAPRHLVLLNQKSLEALIKAAGFKSWRWHDNPLAYWQMWRAGQNILGTRKALTALRNSRVDAHVSSGAREPEFLSLEVWD